MMRFHTGTAASVAVLFLLSAAASASDYHVSPSGDDGNTGETVLDAWRTIGRANAQDFDPGDRLLFEGGQTFAGNLALTSEDAGTPASPVIVGSYGAGRATIDAGDGTGVLVQDAGGVEVRDLVVAGTDRTTNAGSGVYVYNSLSGSVKFEHIRVHNVEAHGFRRGGIVVECDQADHGASGYDDVRITNCVAHTCMYYGIDVNPWWVSLYGCTDVYVGHCLVYDISGDPDYTANHSGSGIRVMGTDGALIEYCVVYNTGYLCPSSAGGPIGIWYCTVNNGVIQFCESYGNSAVLKDGGGFDLDGGCSNCTIQYNYSHDNAGSGFLACQYLSGEPVELPDWENNVVRYNVSENDGRENGYGGMDFWSDGTRPIANSQFYSNTFFTSPPATGSTQVVNFMSGGLSGLSFWNNLFVTTGGVRLVNASSTSGTTFQGNCYWPSGDAFEIRWGGSTYDSLAAWRTATGQETLGASDVGYELDPGLTSPGGGGTIGDALQLPTLDAYRLSDTSDMIDAGLDLAAEFGVDPGARDYYGAAVPQSGAFAVGAHERPPVAPDAPAVTTHPSDESVEEGSSATFTVAATGTSPLYYHWQEQIGASWLCMGGEESPTLAIDPATVEDNGRTFRCVVTNAVGSATTNAATLTVGPAGTLPPANTSGCVAGDSGRSAGGEVALMLAMAVCGGWSLLQARRARA